MAKDSPHGSRQRYRSGCKCAACRKAASQDVLKRRRFDARAKETRARASRADFERNRATRLASMKAWRESFRGQAVRAQHRMKRKGVPFTENGLAYVEILLADPCSYCEAPAAVADHIQPIALGGDGDFTNLTAACQACNARKHAKELLRFLLDR